VSDEEKMIAYGPVPSRRLGKSLGINNIPPKICTYSCVYCQLGRTLNMKLERETFYEPEKLLESIKKKVNEARKNNEHIDFLTFVPDGEPTLDINLGRELELVKSLGIKTGVITNSSLIYREDVRSDLSHADWVSLKIDAVNKDTWKKIDRPHGMLDLDKILEGIKVFSDSFNGDLVTETMLVKGINDNQSDLEDVAFFISGVKHKKSYLSIPIRPPAEKWVNPASEYSINKAFQIFKGKSIDVEYLIGYEGNAFAHTGEIEDDILSITSVHPMKKEAVEEFLKKAGSNWDVIQNLLLDKKLVELEYKKDIFYMRKLR